MAKYYTAHSRPPRNPIVFNPENSKTKQSDLKGTLISNIVKQYTQTGVWFSNGRKPIWENEIVDFPRDFAEAHARLEEARKDFFHLPHKIREYFGHNPYNLLDFLRDPNNADKAIEIGLIKPKNPPQGTSPEAPKPAPEGASIEATQGEPK